MKRIILTRTPTPIQFYDTYKSNKIFIKRDDLTDLALGGNKVRKLEYFLAEARSKKADCIVTYGSVQSNHCRLTAAAASKLGLKTVLILARSKDHTLNGNFLLYHLLDADIVWTEIDKVPEAIDETLNNLNQKGYTPYFIQGGGHGNLGTHAYKEAFEEIIEQQIEINIEFDYIFHASGTGTTQAGLVAGKMIHQSSIIVVGVSIARRNPRGKQVIIDSLKDYFLFKENGTFNIKNEVIFDDSYIGRGYADIYPNISKTIKNVARNSGILLDPVYTGKAFYGMLDNIEKNRIKNKNILFIHTGGSPLLFSHAGLFGESY